MAPRGRRRSRTPAFWIFSIGAALYGLVASGIGLFNESILAERGFGADVYYQTLIVTAITALTGNFGGGWLATRMPLPHLLAISLFVLAAGLAALPHVTTIAPGDGVGDGDGARRRPRDGAVLQRVAARLRPRASRAHPGRGAGDDGARVGDRSAAARRVHRVDRQPTPACSTSSPAVIGLAAVAGARSRPCRAPQISGSLDLHLTS